jgi:formylglycine-generating enzyme required for sulfatase activity
MSILGPDSAEVSLRITDLRQYLNGILLVIVGLAGIVLAPSAAAIEGRVALVIGNSAYAASPLRNPANDAADLAAELEKKGFNVLLRENVGERGLKEAVDEFAKFLKRGGVGLFFFAGHGVQFGDQNYLMPTDIPFKSEADIKYKSVSAEYVLARMAEAGNRVNIVILDACRDNPFSSSQSGSKGLGAMNVGRNERGTYISYATSPGSTAADGSGRNGMYTKHLLRSLELRDSDIDKVFGRVRSGVVQDTDGNQVPWTSTSIIGNFYFDPDEERRAAAQPVAPTLKAGKDEQEEPAQSGQPYDPVEEKATWDRIRISQNAADYNNYLSKFPGGPNAAFARFRLKRLGGTESAPSAAASRPSPAAQFQPPPRPAAPPVQVASIARPQAAPPAQAIAAPAVVQTAPNSVAVVQDCPECPDLVAIPAGEFVMGSAPGESGSDSDEGPQHTVRIPAPLAVGRYEVTRAQFAAFVKGSGYSVKSGCISVRGAKFLRGKNANGQSPGFAQTQRDPVVCVSWTDATAYTQWLSKKTGKAYRLLSEAEWEYAARGGGPSGTPWGSDDAAACRFANVADKAARSDLGGMQTAACNDGFVQTAPVGRFGGNAFGLHDMLGNAWEWVADCWNENYQGAPTDGSARQTGTCGERPFRGGSWNTKLNDVRPGYRDREEKDERHDNLGFRVVRPLN